uniref:Uncharacterized protein n=1 Tax=Nelumbo nucifera TaxID=4432 RepID=A0A822YIJ1_NELNU|nr:TPA_asm: hypothetical protein HUJ06_011251 [Nelumbo nucifera]
MATQGQVQIVTSEPRRRAARTMRATNINTTVGFHRATAAAEATPRLVPKRGKILLGILKMMFSPLCRSSHGRRGRRSSNVHAI